MVSFPHCLLRSRERETHHLSPHISRFLLCKLARGFLLLAILLIWSSIHTLFLHSFSQGPARQSFQMGCHHSTLTKAHDMASNPSYGAKKRRARRKKQLLEALAGEAKLSSHAELLSCVPGRMCVNGSSRTACIFTQQGRKGINQDAMIVWENFGSMADTVFCGVFDGHGPYGHLVARKVRDLLPAKLASYWTDPVRDQWAISYSAEEEDLDLQNSEIFRVWRDCFLMAYNVMDKELKTYPTIDCFCSGTTAVTLLLQGKDLILANVGDSRAVLGTRSEDNSMEAIQLTVDLKPNLPNEAERIKQCKGRVFSLEDEPEVVRIWLPHDNSPGLAMARAFGDFCLKDFGLIAVPDISYREITEKDQFIVLATDGVWDVLSNKEVVDVVSSAPIKTTAARAVVEAAIRSWRLKYPTSKIDDCAVVCLFLNQQPLQSSEYKLKGFHNKNKNITDLTIGGKPACSPPRTENNELKARGIIVASDITDGEEVEKRSDSVCDKPMGKDNREVAAQDITNHNYTSSIMGECTSQDDNVEWSALEGITRVNSILNLPRLLKSVGSFHQKRRQ